MLVKDKKVSPELIDQIEPILPDWELRFYDDQDMMAIMQLCFPEFIEQFTLFPKLIQRLDVFRMLIVYQVGGFYMDTDVVLYKPLDDLLNNKIVLGEEKTLAPEEMRLPHHQHDLRIANYMFGAVRGHSFLIDFVREALSNNSKPIYCENDILETTGPGLLTNFYHNESRNHGKITLLRNACMKCLRNCCRQPACHFGAYAAHHHNGSWRWT